MLESLLQHFTNYPFNLIAEENIDSIDLKLENTSISISRTKIISDKPLFIELKSSILRVWNCLPSHDIYDETYRDDFSYACFDEGQSIVSACIFQYMTWPLPTIGLLKKINVNGNNNIIELSQEFTNETIVCIDGENNTCIKNN